jgi:DNA-binding MarR family transcriptional regulator
MADDELSEVPSTELSAELSTDDWEVWRDFMAMSSQLARELDRRLQADAGISHADYSVLLVLQQAPEHQLRTGELAELLAWEKSRVSHQVARMESRGLLERSECDTDGRGTWVTATAEGRHTLLGSVNNHTRAIRELFFDVLRDDQRDAIGDASVRVLDTLSPVGCELAATKGMTRARAQAPA